MDAKKDDTISFEIVKELARFSAKKNFVKTRNLRYGTKYQFSCKNMVQKVVTSCNITYG